MPIPRAKELFVITGRCWYLHLDFIGSQQNTSCCFQGASLPLVLTLG
jgi:hypothetical protein